MRSDLRRVAASTFVGWPSGPSPQCCRGGSYGELMIGRLKKSSGKLPPPEPASLRPVPPLQPEVACHRKSLAASAAWLSAPRRTHIAADWARSEEHTSELQSLMRISSAFFCLKKNKYNTN